MEFKPFFVTKEFRKINKEAYLIFPDKRYKKPNKHKKWCYNCIMYKSHWIGSRLFRKREKKI